MQSQTTIIGLNDRLKQAFNITSAEFLNEGSQKLVFCVERNGQKCILKLFKNFGERDVKEIEIYKKYEHLSGIPKIIETGEFDGDAIVFEELIEGETLDDVCDSYHRDDKKIAELIGRIVDILKPMWEAGIVHRDIKPSNIIISQGNIPVVIDFGIAKDLDTSTITTVGFQPHTWKFASPEQLAADKTRISYRTDFFSLGVLAYYLYHKQLPFGDSREMVEGVFQSKTLEPTVDEACLLGKMILETLQYNPSERPSRIDTLKELITI